MSRLLRGGSWLSVLLLAACGSNGGGTDATDDADVQQETDVEQDAEAGDAGDGADQADVPEPLDLEPGQVVELTAGADGSFLADLATPGDDRQFGLILYSAAWASGTLAYTVSATGAAASRTDAGAAKSTDPPRPRIGRDFSALIPGLARELREGRTRVARDPMPPPTEGEHRSFQLLNAADAVVTIDAECLKVGNGIAAWIDRTTAGSTDPTTATLDEVVAQFGDVVLARERTYFGQEPDINADTVVNLVWSPIVDEIGAMAYFYPCDLYDSASLPYGCPYSNEQEILYAVPPSMLPRYMGTPAAILETVAHELQHLIYFNRKVLVGGASGNENAYILEGWAAMGEDVSGYGRGMIFVAGEGLDNSDQYGAIEVLRSGAGYNPSRDGMLRAAAYLLVRYLWDRAGGEQVETDGTLTDLGAIAWARTTIDSAREGGPNLEDTAGAPIDDLVFDWYTALLLTGRTDAAGAPLPVEPRFTYLPTSVDPITSTTRGFDPFADFMGMITLAGPHTVTLATADGEIPGTGNEMILLEADGTSPTLSVAASAEAITELRVRVVRLR
jgi:hypothetical protein